MPDNPAPVVTSSVLGSGEKITSLSLVNGNFRSKPRPKCPKRGPEASESGATGKSSTRLLGVDVTDNHGRDVGVRRSFSPHQWMNEEPGVLKEPHRQGRAESQREVFFLPSTRASWREEEQEGSPVS